MGLFTNNKKLCPVCGKPTPRFLAASVEDKPLCKECAAKIDLPNGALEKMTLDSFIKYTIIIPQVKLVVYVKILIKNIKV